MILDQSIAFFKGVGPAKSEQIKIAFGVLLARDLLDVFPYRYLDKTKITAIKDIHPDSNYILIKAKVVHLHIIKGKGSRLIAEVKDDSGTIQLVWFKNISYINSILILGENYLFSGKINVFNGLINLPHPEIEESKAQDKVNSYLLPIYPSTEALKRIRFNNKLQRDITMQVINTLNAFNFPEYLPPFILAKFKLIGIIDAYKNVHFPASLSLLENAKMRLIFNEFFINQIFLLIQKQLRRQNDRGYVFKNVGINFNTFYSEYLPFELTQAQKRVVKEIRRDTQTNFQMNRLLQGDVGSGKTIVALLAALLAIDNGFQVCLMAPLEILAKQHILSIKKMLGSMNISVGYLSGSSKAKEKKECLEMLKSGTINLVIGTHALIEDAVIFANLGLVIIDEQHRFGVEQRSKLWKKTNGLLPHILVMTATPIPRTLAMTNYGDLDISILDELPPGRKSIRTSHIFEIKRTEMFAFVREQIHQGRQVFFVFPLIEESEKVDLENLQQGYDRIFQEFKPPDYQISVVHGKMKNEVKSFEMNRFINKETQILISTTVIEVGVDVPNATVMVIENADRFGLSQLHQLRGRVGRGADQSYCILMTSYKISADSRVRLKTLVETNDGFKIAEADLQLRGPGSIDGTRQSGNIEFKIANIQTHHNILHIAREAAVDILESDPSLSLPQHMVLKNYLIQNKFQMQDWSKIS